MFQVFIAAFLVAMVIGGVMIMAVAGAIAAVVLGAAYWLFYVLVGRRIEEMVPYRYVTNAIAVAGLILFALALFPSDPEGGWWIVHLIGAIFTLGWALDRGYT